MNNWYKWYKKSQAYNTKSMLRASQSTKSVILYHQTNQIEKIKEHGIRDMFSLYGASEIRSLTNEHPWYGPAFYASYSPCRKHRFSGEDYGQYCIKFEYVYDNFIDFTGNMGGLQDRLNEVLRFINSVNVSSEQKSEIMEKIVELTKHHMEVYESLIEGGDASASDELILSIRDNDIDKFLRLQLNRIQNTGDWHVEIVRHIIQYIQNFLRDDLDIFFINDPDGKTAACYKLNNIRLIEYMDMSDQDSQWIPFGQEPVSQGRIDMDVSTPFDSLADDDFLDLVARHLNGLSPMDKFNVFDVINRLNKIVHTGPMVRNVAQGILNQYPDYVYGNFTDANGYFDRLLNNFDNYSFLFNLPWDREWYNINPELSHQIVNTILSFDEANSPVVIEWCPPYLESKLKTIGPKILQWMESNGIIQRFSPRHQKMIRDGYLNGTVFKYDEDGFIW